MANDEKPEGQETEGTEGAKPEGETDQEKAFWSRLDERLDAGIERGVKRYMARAKPGTKRTEGRNTLPKIFADFMGGPFKPVE